VPLAITGPGVRVDGVEKYDEIAVASGGLGRIRGKNLLPIMLDLAKRSEMYGA
jgi:2,3-bisphosphoglycerate-independent phosphoglycerate mutase